LNKDFRGKGSFLGNIFGFYKTRHILLSDSANCTVLRAVVSTQYRRVTDGKTDGQTDRQTSRLVFTARLRPQFRTPPVPNDPSSECPRASIAARRRAAGSIKISRRASCYCSSAITGIAIGANFKIYLLRQFCSNRVEFFYNTQETQTQKNVGPEF